MHGEEGCPQLPVVVICVPHHCTSKTTIDSPPLLIGKEILLNQVEIVFDGCSHQVIPVLPIMHLPVLLPSQHCSHCPQILHPLQQNTHLYSHLIATLPLPIIHVPSCCVEQSLS